MINFNDLQNQLYVYNKDKLYTYDTKLELHQITSDKIIFEEAVKLNCFYCKNYDNKWTCPPRIPDLDYKTILSGYTNIAVILYKTDVDADNFEMLRNKSTNVVHESILFLEKFLWENDYPMVISFIGGSCKLCKNGCASGKCANKGIARIPIEALGINVIKTMKNINIDIIFPPTLSLMRCGMILW